VAAHDVLAESLQPHRQLANTRLERRRWLHMEESHLERKLHEVMVRRSGGLRYTHIYRADPCDP
jgi:hypothetical protein